MIESLLFIVLPYLALATFIGGSLYRARTLSLTTSTVSSQLFHGQSLAWGSRPWRLVIVLILLAHLVALFLPVFWQAFTSVPAILLTVETIGVGLGIGAMVGLGILLFKGISAREPAVTSAIDLAVLLLLLLQVGLGVAIALRYKWGAIWCEGTMTPYIWSILSFQPNIADITELPVLAKLHITLAWLLILLTPFSQLIHIVALPFNYLFPPKQASSLNSDVQAEALAGTGTDTDGRRYFLRGTIALSAGSALLSIGAFEKLFRFFFGPRLTEKAETEIMSTRLQRLQATADQRKLELEREQTNYILIAALDDLSETEGRYFIDYEMRPGLAFKGKDGLPNLLSAKCTHLGCTVGNQVNHEGKILCPCHVSYFDVTTGVPNANAPAKTPLPHLGWTLMDKKGKILLSSATRGKPVSTKPETFPDANVYIVKNEGAVT